jgi:hypothetical protein
LQFARGYSPLEAGVALLPLPIVFVAVSPSSASLAARFGAAPVIATGLGVVGAGFVLLSRLTPGTSYAYVAMALAVLGAGMGATAAPGTGEIMSAVPLSKAGVGSAVNDTTRELGGAVGIALLGSLVTSRFRSGISGSVAHFPAAARDAASHGVSSALEVARSVPRQAGAQLADTARHAFASGMLHAFVAGAALSLLAAVVVFRFLPKGLRPREDDPDTPPSDTSDAGTPSHERREAVSHV